ncbi:MAG: hypothetical protein K2G25_06460 [Oscillospiraceae bacterium]|nr:hypothetical protein [Oscillospiraceae bacterium]
MNRKNVETVKLYYFSLTVLTDTQKLIYNMKPKNFIGRCSQQVEEFIRNCVQPVLDANGVSDDHAEINV